MIKITPEIESDPERKKVLENYTHGHYYECPREYQFYNGFARRKEKLTIFFGGGISNCPDWQEELACRLPMSFAFEDVVILNPRRANFDVGNESLLEEQIKWEFDHLRLADVLIFWFPKESLCPITLFELGKHLNRKRLVVGCHPEYSRIKDLQFQLKLEREDLKIAVGFENFFHAIRREVGLNECRTG